MALARIAGLDGAIASEVRKLQNNYERFVPPALQDEKVVRTLLEYVVTHHTHKISYNLDTQLDLCFDSAAIFFSSLKRLFPALVVAVPGREDHTLLKAPKQRGVLDDDLIFDCSWRQFFAPYAKRNPELYAALPQVLIKTAGQLPALVKAMAVAFKLTDAETERVLNYYSCISSISDVAENAQVNMNKLMQHLKGRYGAETEAKPTVMHLYADIKAKELAAAAAPIFRGSFEVAARDLIDTSTARLVDPVVSS